MLLSHFQQQCQTLGLSTSRLLLAVSGGRDSVALEHLCQRAGYSYAIAHCNFHLRGAESDRDEQFVRQLAQTSGVEIYVAQFDTQAYATQHSLSIEEAARRLRYDYFEQLSVQHNYDYIVVAHHRDDSIETFFINLLRGTGIAGLHGIRPLNGRIARPLLDFSRQQIDDYIAQHRLHFVDDSTNATDLYRRNAIRHRLLPLLRELSPSFDHSMQQTMQHLADTEQIYRQHLQHTFAQITHIEPNGIRSFLIDDLLRLQPRTSYLYELLHPYGFTLSQVEDIISALDAPSGRQFVTDSHIAVKDRERLLLTKLIDHDISTSDGINARIKRTLLPPPQDLRQLRTLSNATCAYFDADRVLLPISLRHWCEGDRFHPYGMQGSQLLSDYFSDHKFSILDKQRQLLLVDARDTILWIVGHRTSAAAAVTPTTRTMLKIEIQ